MERGPTGTQPCWGLALPGPLAQELPGRRGTSCARTRHPAMGFLLSLVPVRLPCPGLCARPWGAGLKKKAGLCFWFSLMQLGDKSYR